MGDAFSLTDGWGGTLSRMVLLGDPTSSQTAPPRVRKDKVHLIRGGLGRAKDKVQPGPT